MLNEVSSQGPERKKSSNLGKTAFLLNYHILKTPAFWLGFLFFGAFILASLLGWLAVPPAHFSVPFIVLAGFFSYGSLLFYVWALSHQKPAPAFRHPLSPFVLLVFCSASIQLSGSVFSPFFSAYFFLIFSVYYFQGWKTAFSACVLACLVEGSALWHLQRQGLPLSWASFSGFGLALLLGWLVPQSRVVEPNREDIKTNSSLPATLPAPEVPLFDAADFLEKNYAALLEMAFLAHPRWHSLMLLWKEGAKLVCRKALSRGQGLRMQFEQEEGGGLFGWVLKEEKALHVSKMPAVSAAALPYYSQTQPVQAFACVPFFSEGSLLGAVMADKIEENQFEKPEMEFLEALGRQIVLATQQAQFSAQNQLQSQQFSRLYQVSQKLGQDLDWDHLLLSLQVLLRQLVSFDSFYMALKDADEQSFKIIASQGYDEKFVSQYHLDPKGSLGSWVLTQGEGVLFNGGKEEHALPAFLAEGLMEGARSSLLIPLLLSHQVNGILKLDSRAASGFSPRDKEVASIFASQAAVTLENARLYTRHKQLATTDGLTGLYNHRYFQERLGFEISRSERSGKPLSIALLDIDFFKKFNDTFGHQEGDEVLKKVARLAKEKVRAGIDVACRYGGEEFVLILPEADVIEAREIADRLRSFCASNLIGGKGPEARPITMSIGICTFPLGAKNQRDLIHLADQALYQAKQSGRNRVCTFKELA